MNVFSRLAITVLNVLFEEPQGLPEDANSEFNGQRLVAMKVILRDKDGKLLDSVTVERIIGGLDK